VKNMKRVQGFTLIELMIVIAIVAILVALAVPAYKDYTIRAKITECVNGAAVAKLQISEYRETVGLFPGDETLAGTTNPAGVSKFCEGFTYTGSASANDGEGSFDILVNEANIDGGLLQVEPQMYPRNSGQGGVDWFCQRGNTGVAELKYLPSTCRATNS